MATRASGLLIAQVALGAVMPADRCPRRLSASAGRAASPANLVNQGRRPLAMPSATHMRISAPFCTESFQRYGSSTPTLKMPPMALRPKVARYSLPFLPLAQGGVEPAAGLAVGEERRRQLADRLHVELTQRAAAGVGDDSGPSGLILRISPSHSRQSSNRRCCCQRM